MIVFVEDAFVEWRGGAAYQPEGADALDLAVMKAATMISANPLDLDIAARAIEESPYNRDYFLREFQKRVGRTPRKYQEFKRMERAMHILEAGTTVGAAAVEVGYTDPYYFSRMFKKTLGVSPRDHLRRMHRSRVGGLMGLDETDQELMLSGNWKDEAFAGR